MGTNFEEAIAQILQFENKHVNLTISLKIKPQKSKRYLF